MSGDDRLVKEHREGLGLELAALESYRVLMDPETPPQAKAALLREYRMAVAALEARPKPGGSRIDELAAKRKERRKATG